MKRKARTAERETLTAAAASLGDVVLYPDGRLVKLTADLCGGRMGREVIDGREGPLGNWIQPDAVVSLVKKYQPATRAMNNNENEVDPLIAASPRE